MKMNIRISLSLVLISTQAVFAQISSISENEHKQSYEKNILDRQQLFTETNASTWFDVTYYRLELDITTQPNYLNGKVTISGVCRTDSTNILTLDLLNQMHVDSVLEHRQAVPITQNNSSFDMALSRYYRAGDILSINVYYEGIPDVTGFGSFVFGSHAGVPVVYSISEPYSAKDWWPCKDDPYDKADSADIIVTCNSIYKVGSEGILVSAASNGDGTSTYHWKERYPIASYLISVAITNYAQFSNWFRYLPADSMEVLNYFFPEDYLQALQGCPRVLDMLKIYSNLFGLYPFIKEKYGHAEVIGGSAMEHQTMTSTPKFDEDVLSHELAHQWFGDMITCRSWSELWLNEGFAQYSSALYREQQYGMQSYWTYMNSQLDLAKSAIGEIGVADLSSVRNLFDPARIYAKGACVLHMLRHVLGDTIFFRSLRAYANNPVLKYNTATIQDFQTVCESVSGKGLNYFFQEWIYGEGYPVYEYSWTWKSFGDSSAIVLDIDQTNHRGNPIFFAMPVDIRITAAGRDTVLTVFNDAQQQRFIIKADVKPSAVLLDPGEWILKTAFSEADRPPTEYTLEQNYPNPFNSATNIIYRIPRQQHVVLRIFDILGREVAVLVDSKQSPGSYECQWIPYDNASGIYFYRLVAGSIQLRKKMIFLK